MRRPRSLRRQLLVRLLPLYVLVGVIAAAACGFGYGRMVDTFMDQQMQLLAESYQGRRAAPVLAPLDDERVRKAGAFVVQFRETSGRLHANAKPGLSLPPADPTAAAGFQDLTDPAGESWRSYSATVDTGSVRVLQSQHFRRLQIAKLALAAGGPVALLLPLSLAILCSVVGAASRSLRQVAQSAAEQNERSIAALPMARVPDEIVPLVTSFNALLERLRAAFDSQRRFVQDAAHELRTPVTAMALQLDNLRSQLPPGEATPALAALQSGIARMGRLIEQLLRLSRQESPAVAEPAIELSLRELLRERIGELMMLADRRGIDLGFEGDGDAVVQGARGELRSVFDNLIDNALRYTPGGGTVDVRLDVQQGQPVVEVIDSGPGIPPDLLERAFDRFFRVPGSGAAGTGLGLAIARAAAQRNGLRIELRNRGDAGRSGLVARVLFPSPSLQAS